MSDHLDRVTERAVAAAGGSRFTLIDAVVRRAEQLNVGWPPLVIGVEIDKHATTAIRKIAAGAVEWATKVQNGPLRTGGAVKEAFGTIIEHLGDGKFKIKPNDWPVGAFTAQVLPMPGVPDYQGRIFTRDAINEMGNRMIGREVVADVRDDSDRELVGFSIFGSADIEEKDGFRIVCEPKVNRVEPRLGP